MNRLFGFGNKDPYANAGATSTQKEMAKASKAQRAVKEESKNVNADIDAIRAKALQRKADLHK